MVDTERSPKPARIAHLAGLLGLLIAVGLPVAVIVTLLIGSTRQAVVVGIAYACGLLLLGLLLYWWGAISSWRSSRKLWRERMASGFYKTLPPVKDDEDD
jgi:Zn-dependent protease with chaperone function